MCRTASLPRSSCVTPVGCHVAPSLDPLLAGKFESLPPNLTPRLPSIETRFPQQEIRSSSRLCAATAWASASLSLDVVLSSLPCILWPSKRLLTRYYPCPSLQKITSKFFPAAALLQKIDLLILTRCVLQVPLKFFTYIFLLENQRPRLTSNQWLRSFWLDPRLFLEVTPTV